MTAARLSSAEEVRNVLARIAHTADAAESVDANVELYTEDAEWQLGGTCVQGRAALRLAAQERRAAGRAGPGTASRHLISTTTVEIDGDRAVAESYWQFFIKTTTEPTLDSMGHYRDNLIYTDRGWRVQRREITLG